MLKMPEKWKCTLCDTPGIDCDCRSAIYNKGHADILAFYEQEKKKWQRKKCEET